MTDDWTHTIPHYKCSCVIPMMYSLVDTLLPLEEVVAFELKPVTPWGATGTQLRYLVAGDPNTRQLCIEHTYCPFCGKKYEENNEN